MVKKAIELKDIRFTYDTGQPLLKNLSLEIKKGECVLITGA